MKLIKSMLFVLAVGSVLSFAGCKEKSPLEKAGDAVGEAVEDTGDAIKDATN